MRARQRPFQRLVPTEDRHVLGIAFADVVAEHSAALAQAIHARYGLTYTPDEIRSPQFGKLLYGDDENHKRVRWVKQWAKTPEFLLSLSPVPGFFDFWNSDCLAGFARRILVPATFDEGAVRQWCQRNRLDAAINPVRGVDGWQRQTRARWIVAADPVWLVSVEDQAIAFRTQGSGIPATSFFDITKIVCQSDTHE